MGVPNRLRLLGDRHPGDSRSGTTYLYRRRIESLEAVARELARLCTNHALIQCEALLLTEGNALTLLRLKGVQINPGVDIGKQDCTLSVLSLKIINEERHKLS